MRAVVCKELTGPQGLAAEDIPAPEPGPGEVRIRVRAAGVNFADTLIIEGRYQDKPALPFVPGMEIAGRIDACGPEVAGLAPGDRVMALTGWGSFAEQVAVGGDKVMPIPPSLDFNSAAAFGMTYGTSMHALKQRANLQPGETLLVLGASGGVGLAAVEIGKAMGAKVIAAASSDAKLEVAKAAGADVLINYSEGSLKDQLKAITGGQGVDVIYDPVGGDLFEEAFRSIAWNGRMLVVGFASGTIPSLPANLTISGELERVFAGSASADALKMLGADPPALGRLLDDRADFAPDGRVSAVVISDALWRRHFSADPTAVGRRIEVNGIPVQIAGVLRPGLKVFLPVELNAAEDIDVWFPAGISDRTDTRSVALVTAPIGGAIDDRSNRRSPTRSREVFASIPLERP